jgi:signal transduction histidine kinase
LQVLLNLLNNAIEAAPSETGKISIDVTIDAQSECININIVDNGCGIEDDNKETVFKAFHTTKGQKGTGLGLAVARKIINEHQGTIDVQGIFGGGTAFQIVLPLHYDGDPSDTRGPATVIRSG